MPLARLRTEAQWDAALATGVPTVVFKHSPSCGVSAHALEAIEPLTATHPDVTVLVVDVIAQRDLSNRIAERLSVVHESPQAIVAQGGRAVWSASHWRISAASLAEGLASAVAAPQADHGRRREDAGSGR